MDLPCALMPAFQSAVMACIHSHSSCDKMSLSAQAPPEARTYYLQAHLLDLSLSIVDIPSLLTFLSSQEQSQMIILPVMQCEVSKEPLCVGDLEQA